MGLPKVTILEQNGALLAPADLGAGKAAVIVLCAAAPTGHAFNTIKEYGHLTDLPEELQTNEGLVQYFTQAEGYSLFVMPVDSAGASLATLYDKTEDYMRKLIMETSNVRFAAVLGLDVTETDIAAVKTKAKELADYLVGFSRRLTFIIGYVYDSEETPTDLTTGLENRVQFLCGFGVKAWHLVGLKLGRMASTPIMRHPGRVKSGGLTVADEDMGTATEIAALDAKGYCVLTTYYGKSGAYFANDYTATDPTKDDYSTCVRRHVIDKAIDITYSTLVHELNDEVYVEADGKMSPGIIKYYEGICENAINLEMTANGEISGVSVFVDTNQNVLSTGKIEVVLKVQPVGYAKEFVVKIGFAANLSEEE